MSYESVRVAIDAHIQNNFGTAYPFQPENFDYNPAAGQAWARYSIRPVTSVSADVSGYMTRREHLLWLQIFIPDNAGISDANKIADIVAAACDEKFIVAEDATILFRRAALNFIGTDQTGWQQWRCVVPFQSDSKSITDMAEELGMITDFQDIELDTETDVPSTQERSIHSIRAAVAGMNDPYTASISLPVAGREAGDRCNIQFDVDPSVNPRVQVLNDTSSGTILFDWQADGVATKVLVQLVFDGAAWYNEFSQFIQS